MTAKELRDKKVGCRKVYFLFQARQYLRMTSEREISKSVEQAIESLDAYPDPYFEWMEIFDKYKKENNSEFDMACMPCWDKVLEWTIKNEKVEVVNS